MLQPWLRHFFMSDCVVVEIKEPESAFPAGKPMDNSGLSVFFSIQPSDTFSMKDSGSLISVMVMYQKHDERSAHCCQ